MQAEDVNLNVVLLVGFGSVVSLANSALNIVWKMRVRVDGDHFLSRPLTWAVKDGQGFTISVPRWGQLGRKRPGWSSFISRPHRGSSLRFHPRPSRRGRRSKRISPPHSVPSSSMGSRKEIGEGSVAKSAIIETSAFTSPRMTWKEFFWALRTTASRTFWMTWATVYLVSSFRV